MKQLQIAVCTVLLSLLTTPSFAQQNEFISDYLERGRRDHA